MDYPKTYRARRIIEDIIKALNIDLNGYSILTEVGSNHFIYTPIIAQMANAQKVFAWTRDSEYGNANEIIKLCKQISESFDLPPNIEFKANDRPIEHIKNADIITNLGNIRPLDKFFLGNTKKGAVISLMCESWEVRMQDIDIKFCRENAIKVGGTWENAPELGVFDGCGPLAIKIANESGFEVYQNNIIIWSDDHFGDVIGNSFKRYGANKVIQTISKEVLYENAALTDFIFLTDYDEINPIFAENGIIDILKLQKLNPDLAIIHLYGCVDNEYVKRCGLAVYPDKKGYASRMTYTLAHLGMNPIINLHAAGFKVGELLQKDINNQLVQKMV